MRMDIYQDEQVTTLAPKASAAPWFQVLHDFQLYNGDPRPEVIERGVPLPEIYPLLPNQFTKLTFNWQWLWKYLNPLMSPLDWRKLLHYERAFTNLNGFDKPGDPRADHVNERDMQSPLPKIEALVCGGAFLTGKPDVMYKGEPHLQVVTLDGRQPPPPVGWVQANKLAFEAVSARPDGGVQSFSLTPNPEYVPIVASIFPVYFPMSGLVKV